MSYFENLWEEFRGLQADGRGLTDQQMEQMRTAFFTGAWCHMAFARRLRALQAHVAAEMMYDVEEELFSAMAPPERGRIQIGPAPARGFSN
jgi:hypothetical protein